MVLAVIHGHRLSGLEHVDVDPELLERALALEVAGRAERPVVAPACLCGVEDEPALAVGDEAEAGRAKPCLANGHRREPIPR